MAPIKLDNQTICTNVSGLEILNVVLSENPPFGYNSSTKVLTLPNNARALIDPVWINASSVDSSALGWNQPNGLTDSTYKIVHAQGTTTQQSVSFEGNGIGIEIIHSSENANTLPAQPGDILNPLGFAGRKYPNFKRYLWFDDLVGKFMWWWDTTAWRPLLTQTNTLVVDGRGSGHFSTLSAAYAYLIALPTSGSGPLRPSSSNVWTILIQNRVVETSGIEARDNINVVFMPGGQLYITCGSGCTAAVTFNGSSAIRDVANRFSAIWTSAEKSALTDFSTGTQTLQSGERAYHIVGVMDSNKSVILINDMQQMTLNGLSVYCESQASTSNVSGVRVSGALQLSTNTRARNVVLKDMTVVLGSSTTGGSLVNQAVAIQHTAGNVHLDDCIIACDTGAASPYLGILVNPPKSPTGASLVINECYVAACRCAGSYAMRIDYDFAGILAVSGNSTVFEAYGSPPSDPTPGVNGAALRTRNQCEFAKCVFRIAPDRFITPSGNNPLSGLTTSSPAVYAEVMDGHSAVFHECYLQGEINTSTGLTLANIGTWADSKVVLNKCSVRGMLASIVSMTGTTSSLKRFYGSSFQGAISGTPFGCAAATATLATNYRV